MVVESFYPVWRADAKVIILGSMPGRASLDLACYYAHPRNLFWPIMADVLERDCPSNYDDKLQWLKDHKIALWDVLQSCERKGSLDASIITKSEMANDLPSLFESLKELQLVVFNGRKAEQLFNRHVRSLLDNSTLEFCCLPSTSPANAGIKKEQKILQWKTAIKPILGGL